jgi:hypothetical protein
MAKGERMSESSKVLEPIPCQQCAQAGQPDVLMTMVLRDQQWMNVVVSEPDPFFRGMISTHTVRKKVFFALFRCPYAHRVQIVLDSRGRPSSETI